MILFQKKFVFFFICLSIILIVLLRTFFFQGNNESDSVILVAPGDSLKKITYKLEKEMLVSNSFLFQLFVRLLGKEKSLQSGEYLVPKKASMFDIMNTLSSGKVILYPITVVEGMTSYEVLKILNSSNILSGALLEEVPSEGSILPETYFVPRNTERALVLKIMQDAMVKLVEKYWNNYHLDLPFKTRNAALTLASIVEKETALASERRLIASVFINRLREKMRLQSDVTVIYGLTSGKGRLGHALLLNELKKKTPFNTYVIAGLPPGPIANPGEDSIRAVFNPVESEKLYFVADGQGGHNFSETLAEHNRNVVKWRNINK